MSLKIICIILCLCVFLGGCGYSQNSIQQAEPIPADQNLQEIKGVWISYIELSSHDKTEAGFKNMISTMFKTVADNGFNSVFVHVRPNADALYPSDLFPHSAVLTGVQGKDPGFDALEFMVTTAHELGLSFHAWINPYRVASSANSVADLAETNPARIFLTDADASNDNMVKVIPAAGGKQAVFFNPSSTEAQKLIINGVREIIENYDIDGIQIDDYFYPTPAADFDINEYNTYCEGTTAPLSHGDWRRLQVDSLVSALYRVVHSKEGVLFGISPSAHISENGSDKNYNEQFANIAKWMKEDNYADYIAPQLYFGYNYPEEEFRFDNILKKWASLERCEGTALYIGLAAYKIGTADAGTSEWQTEPDILARQCTAAKSAANGVIFYSYSTLFSGKDINKKNLENLKNTSKSGSKS